MADIRISPRGVACLWLSHIRWSRLIGVFLLCLIILAVISHNYLTDINSDPPDTHNCNFCLLFSISRSSLLTEALNKSDSLFLTCFWYPDIWNCNFCLLFSISRSSLLTEALILRRLFISLFNFWLCRSSSSCWSWIRDLWVSGGSLLMSVR
jgi:hypothetical protein